MEYWGKEKSITPILHHSSFLALVENEGFEYRWLTF
jgi:hypothetical protein